MTTDGDYDDFLERRARAVVSPLGPLALVGTQVIDSEQPVWGVPGRWAPLPDGGSGLLLTASAEDGIAVDGEIVDGTVVVAGPDSVTPSTIRFDEHTVGTLLRADGGSTALRVWDAESDAIANFGRIDVFPFDAAWVVEGHVVPLPDDAAVTTPHTSSPTERRHATPAEIRVEVVGERLALLAFPDGDRLQVVFSDATSGDTSYSVGRFLFLEPRDDGTVAVDFTRAELPPCAFSYHFNCPIPPPQNRVTIAITAGERLALDRDGDPLHV